MPGRPRLTEVVGACAYGVFAVCDVVFWHGVGHALLLVLALSLLLPATWVIVTLFVTLIVLGESFRIPHAGKLSVVHLLTGLTILKLICTSDIRGLARSIRRLTANRPLTALLVWVAGFAAIGLARGNAVADVAEAVLPFLYCGLTVLALGSASERDFAQLRVLLLLALVVACVKVLVISAFDVNALWDNAWQAARTPIPGSPLARAVLRGADVFLVMGLVAVASALLFGAFQRRAFALATAAGLLPLLVVGNFLSMTRSNYIGAGAGLLVLIVFGMWPRRHVVSRRALVALVTAMCIALVVFLARSRARRR